MLAKHSYVVNYNRTSQKENNSILSIECARHAASMARGHMAGYSDPEQYLLSQPAEQQQPFREYRQ